MKLWLFSAVGSIFIVASLRMLGHYYPDVEPWNLMPGIYVALLFPGIHAVDLRSAASVYNIVIYALLIRGTWQLLIR
jgi:hypothetical protein